MRQPPSSLRQSQGGAVGASWMAWLGSRQFLRGLIIAATVGAFLAFVGAFGTDAAPIGLRLGYWVGIALLGAIFAGLISFLMQQKVDFGERPWLWGVVMAVGLSVPFTVVVFAVTALVFGGGYGLGRLIGFFPPVLLVTAAITGLNFLVHARAEARTAATSDNDAPPRFLDRLPLKLRGAEVWAVEAEDHYLRLHTSKGQDLILMRLGDAVAELDGIEGARTHRSWWVAREAVTDVKRGDGRATLTLKDGAQIPVSRAYARALREAGWF
jgi:hypothetical protein